MTDKKLSDLEVGDQVWYSVDGNARIETVIRKTPKGMIVTAVNVDDKPDLIKTWNKNGSLRGSDDWSRISDIKYLTDDKRAAIYLARKRNRMINRLLGEKPQAWDKLTFDQLKDVVDMLDKANGE